MKKCDEIVWKFVAGWTDNTEESVAY